jgi:hypothetical protein
MTKQQAIAQAIDNVRAAMPDAAAALEVYAGEHGNDWVKDLADDWFTGRDASYRHPESGERLGHFLRRVRNSPELAPAFFALA